MCTSRQRLMLGLETPDLAAQRCGMARGRRTQANVPQMPCRPEPDVFMMVQSDRDRDNGLKRSALNRMALLATLRNSAAIGSAPRRSPKTRKEHKYYQKNSHCTQRP